MDIYNSGIGCWMDDHDKQFNMHGDSIVPLMYLDKRSILLSCCKSKFI